MLASLRVRVVLLMIGMSLVGMLGAFVLITQVERVEERAAARRDASSVAHRVAKLLAGRPLPDQTLLAAIDAGLGDDGILISERGAPVLSVPYSGKDPTVSESVPMQNGKVTVTTAIENTRGLSLELTAISGGLLLLGAVGGIAVIEAVSRGVRRPIARAVAAADRVASGDFSARIGRTGTAEFGRLAQSFDSMAARLADSDRRERHFLADLAHEVATPLSIITGFAVSLADGTVTKPAEQREAAELIAAETDRLSGLLDDLRQLTGLDWNQSVHPQEVDLAELCLDLVARFRPTARQDGISLAVQAAPLLMTTDRRLVDTVAVNLLTNALRYTPRGGQVSVILRANADEVVIAVRDTGIGISPQDKERVFDRLYRVDEARDRVTGGSGLGLAIARRAALALGGRLELDSTVGEGSEFRLVLPRRVSQPHSAAAPSAKPA